MAITGLGEERRQLFQAVDFLFNILNVSHLLIKEVVEDFEDSPAYREYLRLRKGFPGRSYVPADALSSNHCSERVHGLYPQAKVTHIVSGYRM